MILLELMTNNTMYDRSKSIKFRNGHILDVN